MAAANTAYDFERFETKKPQIKLVDESKKSKAKKTSRSMPKMIVLGIAMTVIFSAVLYNRAVMTELCDKVNQTKASLTALQSESARLKLQLEGITSLNKVEQYAQTNLNMVKAEKYQTTYITLDREDKVEVEKKNDGFIQSLFVTISSWF